MDADKFKFIYESSRNGANYFVRHPLVRRFTYSDGVHELADLGGYWLLNILATEGLEAMVNSPGEHLGQVDVTVDVEGFARIELSFADNKPPAWKRSVDWADLPVGKWTFLLADDSGDRREVRLFLLTEY